MEHQTQHENTPPDAQGQKTFKQHVAFWLTDPLRSVVVASATCMSSLGIVLGGSWFISLAVS